MAEIFQNRDQNIEHVELSIAAHRMRILGITALLEHIAGFKIYITYHLNVCRGLLIFRGPDRRFVVSSFFNYML